MRDAYLDGITKGQAFRDASRAYEKAAMDIARWAGPKFDQGLTVVDLVDQHGSGVMTELWWQTEQLEPLI